jgi:alkylhydroperoxidase family enzyme
VLLHQPPVAGVIAGVLLLMLYRTKKLDRRLRELIIMRIGWVTGCDYEWTQHWRIALDLGLPEADLLGVRDWRGHAGFGTADRAVLAATDDVLTTGRISDASWDAWNATGQTIEATIEMVVAIGVWRMVSEQLLSLGISLEDGVAGWPPDGKHPSPRPPVHFDGSVSAVGRLSPLDLAEADRLCRERGMDPFLAKSDVWSRVLRHPPVAQAVSAQLYHLLGKGSLGARLRELVIMRIGWTTGSVYEWTRHWPISTKVGITAAEIIALRDWRNGSFGTADRAVLAATDDTLRDGRISAESWSACAAVLSTEHLVELTAVIGNWHMISHLLRSLAIPLEPGAMHWPPDGKAPFGG